jgi:hypothetical protein
MRSAFWDIEKSKLREHYSWYRKSPESTKFIFFRFLMDVIMQSPAFSPIFKNIIENNHRQYDYTTHQIAFQKEYSFIPDDYNARVAIGCLVCKKVLEQNMQAIYDIGSVFDQENSIDTHTLVELFDILFVEVMVSYLLFQDEKTLVVLDLLKAYKHRAEWFDAERLRGFVEDEKRKEKVLARKLYRYLFDRGVEFQIEPESPSGEIDFLGGQRNATEKLLIEVKALNPNVNASEKLNKGYHQVLRYMKDFGEVVGYLVVFNMSGKRYHIENGGSAFFPMKQQNDCCVYFMFLDIFEIPHTASAGKPIEVTNVNIV